MKKIFSMALAGAMIAGLAATSMAATVVQLKGPLVYKSDDKRVVATGTTEFVEYGKAAYYQIAYSETAADNKVVAGTEDMTATATALDNYSDVEKLRVKAKWEMGADLVDSIAIVKKNVSAESTATKPNVAETTTSDSDYAYFVEIKLKSSTSVNDADVIGTLTFTNSKPTIDGDAPDSGKIDTELDIAFTVFFNNNYNNTNPEINLNVIDGTISIISWDSNYAVKFNYDDEVDFEFGKDSNEGTFTVDVSGQGKLLINFNTKLDDAIAAANPNAIMRAVNFNNVTFNRTGEYVYEWEDGGYIYQVIDGQLYTMPNATFANDEYTFNTRTLGSYVFSNIELVNPEIVVETPEVEAPEVNNPGTGAAV